MTETATTQKSPRKWTGWAMFVLALVLTFGLGLLLSTIMERRAESRQQPALKPIAIDEARNEVWGENFPRQYKRYLQTQIDTTRTKFGGADPRDLLKETPANVVLFAGMPFSKDYRQARGHSHAVEDVTGTGRISDKSPGTCWTCKSSDVPRMMAEKGRKEGEPMPTDTESFMKQVMAGAGEFYKTPFVQMKDQITHSIGCLDCHEPNTMRLRISRPALIEAFKRQGKDINNVTHQEMRSLVCAQCHNEYHFKGEGKYLTLPWDAGTTPEAMEAYYEKSATADGKPYVDFTHAISGTPMIKMQHPDYEVYSKGIHAYRNVSCADCHMPYRSEGGVKFTDHHVQSPLLNVSNSCAVCHRWGEDEIKSRVESMQSSVHECRVRAEDALSKAHFDIAAAMQAGAGDDQLKHPRDLVRQAQLRWDYVAASNGMGFHAPQECVRILTAATDLAQQSRVESTRLLARHGYVDEVAYPDVSSKEKAQAVIKLFVDKTPPSLLKTPATSR
jgi:nitrite reductase (cytochrome c-552)